MATPTVFPVINKAGKECYAYFNEAAFGGTFYSAPDFQLQDAIKDLDIGDAVEAYKASIRRMQPFHVYISTMRDLSIKFKVPWIPTDELCIALLAAYQAGTAMDAIFLDGPLVPASGNTSQGPRADWIVTTFPRTEHLAEGMDIDIELKPGLTTRKPSWYTVTTP